MKIDQVVDLIVSKKEQKNLLILTSILWIIGSAGVMVMPFVVPDLVSEWNLTTVQASSLISSVFIGMLLGALFSGIILDYFGRKIGVIFYLLVTVIFTVLFGFSKSFGSAYVFRLLSGFGYGGLLPSVNTYLSEYTSIRLRGRYLVILEASWAVGSILIALFAVTLGEKLGWRWDFYIFSIGIISLIPFFRKKDTPKYIFEKRGVEGLKKIFNKVPENIEEIEKVKVTFSGLFRKEHIKQTILVIVSWFVVSFVYYALFSWAPKIFIASLGITITKAKWYTFFVYLAQLPGYLSVAYLIEKWGRKKTLATYFIGMGLSSFLLLLATGNLSFLFIVLILSFFTLGVWGLVYAYTPELFPTSFRGTANGVAGATARIAGIIAPYFTGYFVDKSIVAALSFVSLFAIFAAVMTLVLGVETKDKAVN
ncbi:major facilitator superfamily MFS_1 [Thermosipho africanus Ob7]|uniref:MFS transporter n=1 Tax=Thermosipho africanus TaxID=2421 RepID=UPI000E0C2DC0|nr:MFS transporter [Thermosipho africanus]RDI92683.1 major facilitator superfamily MFS_1 [Thermosipho africanus Ob7]